MSASVVAASAQQTDWSQRGCDLGGEQAPLVQNRFGVGALLSHLIGSLVRRHRASPGEPSIVDRLDHAALASIRLVDQFRRHSRFLGYRRDGRARVAMAEETALGSVKNRQPPAAGGFLPMGGVVSTPGLDVAHPTSHTHY